MSSLSVESDVVTKFQGRASPVLGDTPAFSLFKSSKLSLTPDMCSWGPKPIAPLPVPGKSEVV